MVGIEVLLLCDVHIDGLKLMGLGSKASVFASLHASMGTIVSFPCVFVFCRVGQYLCL
jgi:hypothetical protein